MKFNEACVSFLDYIEVTKSNGTYRKEKSKTSGLASYFNDCDLNLIDKKKIIAFIRFKKAKNSKVSATTLNMYISTLKRIIKYNTDRVLQFDKLPENSRIPRIIEQEIIDKVFFYYRNYSKYKESLRNLVLFKLLLDTGLRINEALNLKINDISMEANTIHVKITKTKKERYVFFTNSTKEILFRLITTHAIKDYIFISYKARKRLTVDNVQNICFRLEEKLNLNLRIRPHKWRHTFATNFLKRGGDLESLRLILGHTSLKTTQKYLHLDKEFLHSEYFKTIE